MHITNTMIMVTFNGLVMGSSIPCRGAFRMGISITIKWLMTILQCWYTTQLVT